MTAFDHLDSESHTHISTGPRGREVSLSFNQNFLYSSLIHSFKNMNCSWSTEVYELMHVCAQVHRPVLWGARDLAAQGRAGSLQMQGGRSCGVHQGEGTVQQNGAGRGGRLEACFLHFLTPSVCPAAHQAQPTPRSALRLPALSESLSLKIFARTLLRGLSSTEWKLNRQSLSG